jgi:hypothetical protein
MTRPQEDALRVAFLTALRDIIDTEVAVGREESLASLMVLQEMTGAEAIKVRLGGPQGVHVATVALIPAKDGISVDPSKLLAYVKANHPGEVVEAVTEPFRRALVARLKVEDDGTVVDTHTGMAADFATVRPADGKPSLRVTFTTGENPGRALIAKAWRAGELTGIDPTQLGSAT